MQASTATSDVHTRGSPMGYGQVARVLRRGRTCAAVLGRRARAVAVLVVTLCCSWCLRWCSHLRVRSAGGTEDVLLLAEFLYGSVFWGACLGQRFDTEANHCF